jgi:hypothetical protein
MHWYHVLALASLAVCAASSLFHLFRLIRLGKPIDYAPAAGKTGPAIQYAFTGAMSPMKKESAFLHLPTYTAGILYHIGTFTAIPLFFFLLFIPWPGGSLTWLLAGFFVITSASGIGIFIKRFVKKGLRDLSSPDDYISNMLVTLFQLLSALVLSLPAFLPAYFIVASLLLLYFPIGKLKHAIYFFAARYHLGVFYGRRGVWPPKPL